MKQQSFTKFWQLAAVSLSAPLALVALLWLGATTAMAQTQPVSLQVISAPADPILPGKSGVFTVTLANNSDVARTLVLSMTLDGPLAGGRFQPAPATSQGVTTQNAQIRGGLFLWRGEIAPAGRLIVQAQARSEQFASGALSLAAAAGPNLSTLPLFAQSQVTIQSAPVLNPDDLALSQIVADETFEHLFGTASGVEVLSGDRVQVRTVFSNNSSSTIFALVTNTLQPQPVRAAQSNTDGCSANVVGVNLLQGQGRPLPVAALSEVQADYGFVVALDPGEVALMEAQVHAVGDADCSLQGRTEARARAMPAGFDQPVLAEARLVRGLANLPPGVALLIPWLIIASDYGDAPDSFYWGYAGGGDMLAYLSPITVGKFPTSFYATKPSPQGPKHRFVNPLHLGDGFSLELWADRGFRRNIDPLTLASDLDVNDDGIDPAAVAFQHCMPTTVPFRITMSQAAHDRLTAEDGNAYINIWLDGNRDGDWEDWLDCDGIQAPEHIVIDQAIMPPAGGVYDLIAATANLPVPLSEVGKDMWLRITVSDEPSVKPLLTPNGTAYGDGRGPSAGFRYGETEDYLIIADGATTGRGLDLHLDVDVRAQREATFPMLGSAQAANASANKPLGITQRIRIRNLGDVASSSKLIVEMTPFLGIPTTTGGSWTGCLTCTVAASLTAPPVVGALPMQEASPFNLPINVVCPEGETGNCQLELDLATLKPGQVDEVILGWKVEEGMKVSFATRIETPAEDANPQNNRVERLAAASLRPLSLLFPPPGTHAIGGVAEVGASAPDYHWSTPLTATLRLALTGQPGATIKFLANGEDSGEQSLDQQGYWEGMVDVPAGDVNLAVVYQNAPGYTEAEVLAFNQAEKLTSSFKLIADLPWNPGSLRVRPSIIVNNAAQRSDEGDAGLPVTDATGAAVTDGWRLPVRPGQESAVSVDLFCHEEGGGAALRIGGNLFPLSNGGAGDRYSGLFTLAVVEGQRVELIVGCGSTPPAQSAEVGVVEQEDPACASYDQCWIYEGVAQPLPTVQIVNAADGQPVAGAAVQLWRFRRDVNGIQAEAWPGGQFGQQNPTMTDGDGQFGFGLTPGFYGITIAADGFQPFRAGPVRLCCHWPSDIIQLQPLPIGPPVQDITFTEEGFLRSQVEVTPGSIVRLRNLSLGFVSFDEGTGAEAGQRSFRRRSGLLAPGESYLTTFAEGAYQLVNGENQAQAVELHVAPPQSANFQIFLPLAQR
jgi:hypothetical protein